MPPTLGQPPIPLTQPRNRHVAFRHRATAAELDQAARIVPIGGREPALLGEAGPAAVLAGRPFEQPAWPQLLVEVGSRRHPAQMQDQVEQDLGDVVGLGRAARQADDWQPAMRAPVPAEIVGQAHRAGWVVPHRRDAPVGGAGTEGEDRGRPRRQAVDPVVDRDRLAVKGVDAEAAPVSLAVDPLVRDRALDHEDERIEPAIFGPAKALDEVLAVAESQHRIVQYQHGACPESPPRGCPRGSGWSPQWPPASRRRKTGPWSTREHRPSAPAAIHAVALWTLLPSPSVAPKKPLFPETHKSVSRKLEPTQWRRPVLPRRPRRTSRCVNERSLRSRSRQSGAVDPRGTLPVPNPPVDVPFRPRKLPAGEPT